MVLITFLHLEFTMKAFNIVLTTVKLATMKLISIIVFVLCTQISRVFGVIGGSVTEIQEIPFQVGIIPGNNNIWCGGVLISENYVLSSAKCLVGATTGSVMLGFTNMHIVADVISIASILPIDSFDPATLQNDIAIVQLHRSARLSDRVQPVQLPARRNTLTDYSGQQARFSGWGSMTGSAGDTIPAQRLQSARSPIISSVTCFLEFPFNILTSHNICTARGSAIPCHGDDGGGLTVTNAEGAEILVGLISYMGFTNCSPSIPAVYTRIASLVFLNWIAENTDVIIEN